MVKLVIKLAFLTAGLLLLPLLLWHVPLVQNYLSHAHQWQENPWGWVWFCLFAVSYCSFGLSRQALCFAAGMGFGLGKGLFFCTLAYEIAACLIYTGSRFLGRSMFQGQRGQKPTEIYQMVIYCRSLPFLSVLALRLLPVGSALLVSVASGMAELSFWKFASATLIGGLPQTVIFTLMGSGTALGRFNEILLAVLLFIVSSLLGWFGLGSYRQRRKFLKKTSFQSGLYS